MSSNRITKSFNQLKLKNKKAFVPFNILGFPDMENSVKVLSSLAKGGASALEVGIAFSDPLADGPVIQMASHKVLENGFTFKQALEVTRQVRQANENIPINVLSYYNIAHSIGKSKFFKSLKDAGADGITFVDLPLEEMDEIIEELTARNLAPIMLISPLTPEHRIRKILKYARGFVYLVSRLGITGIDESYETTLGKTIKLIRTMNNIPILVGFGISNPQNAQKMIDLGADGVIVGTKILKIIETSSVSNLANNLVSFEQKMLAQMNS